MTTKKISYKEYKKLLNLVAYKIIKSKKEFEHRDKYTVGGKTVSYEKVIDRIKKNGENYTSNRYVARFMEKTIIKDNTNLDFLPTSVSINYEKYSKTDYVDAVKRTVEYRKKHKQNPKQININYAEIPKLYDYMTTQGCSGMGQCTAYNCGCNSLQQCFYRLTGIKVSESDIARWAGTTTSGTDHDGLNTAVAMFNKKYNKNVKIVWYNFSDLGKNSKQRWDKVKELMEKSALFFHLLYRDKYGHYEVIKSVGDELKILNSLGERCNYPAYCGYIETRTRKTQESYINGISQKSVAYLYNG